MGFRYFKRYVDDTNLVVLPVPPGTRYVDNTLIEVPEMKDIDIHKITRGRGAPGTPPSKSIFYKILFSIKYSNLQRDLH